MIIALFIIMIAGSVVGARAIMVKQPRVVMLALATIVVDVTAKAMI